MNILDLVKEVRNRSGASMSVCKRVVEQSNGDVEKALEMLQKQGVIKAADRAGRIATNGRIGIYEHAHGSKVCLVEVNCETDFAAKSSEFQEFCEAVAMQVVGMSPQYVRPDDIPPAVLSKQRVIFMEATQTRSEPELPAERVAKIVDGKLRKWVSEVCLMEQPCAANPEKTMEQLRIDLIAKCGENVTVRRFVRWEVGEGLQTAQPLQSRRRGRQARRRILRLGYHVLQVHQSPKFPTTTTSCRRSAR